MIRHLEHCFFKMIENYPKIYNHFCYFVGKAAKIEEHIIDLDICIKCISNVLKDKPQFSDIEKS